MKLLILATILLAAAGLYTAAALTMLPLATRVGYRAAVRRSGVGMIRGGAFRVRTGRFS